MNGHFALPVSLYLRDRAVCIVGSGPEAERRQNEFNRLGAKTTLVAPGSFSAKDAASVFLLFIMTADPAENGRLANQARPGPLLIYAQDAPSASDFAMPGIAERGYLKVAISTDGLAPALTRHLRQEFQRLLDAAGPVLDPFLTRFAELRAELPVGARKERLLREAGRLRVHGGFELQPGGSD